MPTSSVTAKLNSRIVCLSYDTTEMICSIGGAALITGKPAGARHQGTESATEIGGFKTADIDTIVSLNPDLVIGYSDVCVGTATALIQRHIPTLILQHTTLEEMYRSFLILGRITGHEQEALSVTSTMKREFQAVAEQHSGSLKKPVVYFEEWDKPPVCGMEWVSEIIDIAGGKDPFKERAREKQFIEREISADDIVKASPEIILASWCGKSMKPESFKQRGGWAAIPAVANDNIYSIPGELILQPGPKLVDGARYISNIINHYKK